MQNRLAEVRRERGITVASLAQAAGVRRQTIYSIESGAYSPNTAIALRLARFLQVSVEDIFLCDEGCGEAEAELDTAEVIGSLPLAEGQPVQLCSVGERRIAVPAGLGTEFYPELNGAVAGSAQRKERRYASVQILREAGGHDLLVAGCDPAASLLASPLAEAGVRLIPWIANSSAALQLVKDGHAHVAGCHIYDRKSADSNLAFVRSAFKDDQILIVNFVIWQQGLAVAARNPLGIRGIEDLGRKEIRLANREPGSGARRLTDDLLKGAGVSSAKVSGYDSVSRGHVAAARAVQDGRADCCLSVSSAARLLGLHFIPVVTERYDLAIPKTFLSEKPVQALLDALNRLTIRRMLESACGYDTSATGKIMLG